MQVAEAVVSHAPERNAFLQPDGYHSVTQAGLLSASSRRSTDISLVTAEGDKVTISAKSALQASVVGYDYRGRLHGHEVSLSGRSLQVSSENSFALSVEGDLSKEEIADIEKLVAKLRNSASISSRSRWKISWRRRLTSATSGQSPVLPRIYVTNSNSP